MDLNLVHLYTKISVPNYSFLHGHAIQRECDKQDGGHGVSYVHDIHARHSHSIVKKVYFITNWWILRPKSK